MTEPVRSLVGACPSPRAGRRKSIYREPLTRVASLKPHKCIFHPFTNANTETQRGQITCPRPTAYDLVEAGGLEPKTASKASFRATTTEGVPRPPKLGTNPLDQCIKALNLMPIEGLRASPPLKHAPLSQHSARHRELPAPRGPQSLAHGHEDVHPFHLCKFIYLFIYFWLRWVFVAVRGLSLVVVSGGYSLLWCVGFSLRCLLVAEHGL